MPYSLNELGEVVADTDGVSWADAIKQQRALRANESRVAAMYAELDLVEEVEVEVVPEAKPSSELVKIVVGNEQDKALTASVVQAMDGINQRLAIAEQFNESLVAAMQAMSERDTAITVEAPNVTVEQPAITYQPPEIRVEPNITVEAPNVTVQPEIVLPTSSKTITFERDFDGRVTRADVVEGGDVT